MTKYIWRAVPLLFSAVSLVPIPGQTPAPRKLEILFLGHKDIHHNSTKFEPMLKDALAAEPFNFTYSTDPKDLNDANLSKYDELIIYANTSRSSPTRRKHFSTSWPAARASSRFTARLFVSRTLPQYIALVGAQFQKHKTGEFVADVVKPDHQVMLGIQPFNVGTRPTSTPSTTPIATVLMERVDETGREPWTWIRTHGKGRVFYTAYGHDERVWDIPCSTASSATRSLGSPTTMTQNHPS